MLSRAALFLIRPLALYASLAGSAVSAQSQHPINAFFGFDFVLQALAVKWACGGQREKDLSQIGKLIIAFPKDAEHAELPTIVATLNEMVSGLESLPQVLGAELNGQQIDQLCTAALPLNIDWVTPEQFIRDGEDGIPDKQKTNWAGFFAIVEGFQ